MSSEETIVAYELLPRSFPAAQTGGPCFRSLRLRMGGGGATKGPTTVAPFERSKGKQSYDRRFEARKAGMPSLSIPKGGESRRARMERSKATVTLKFVIIP